MKIVLFVALTVLLTGCVYEKEVTRRETAGARLTSPEPDRYGGLQLVWVREYRAPRGIFRFPDGGKPLEVAMYATINQTGGSIEREIGRIELKPVRKGDFGNLNDATFDWLDPDRLSYWVKYGYFGNLERVVEGELKIPPLR